MYIYKITNLINGKVYIGQTVNSIEIRFNDHCKPSRGKNGSGIDGAIKKYGKENFTVELLATANSIEELNALEIEYIAKYDSMNKHKGYNLCIGGDNTKGYHHKPESCAKMSKSRMGIFAGEKNPFYGKKHSEETKKKLSALKKGKPLSLEHRQHLSNTSPKKRRVRCLNDGKIFNSIKEAENYYGVIKVGRACREPSRSCGPDKLKFVYDNTVPSPSSEGKV